jgi:hypothetical protein
MRSKDCGFLVGSWIAETLENYPPARGVEIKESRLTNLLGDEALAVATNLLEKSK